MNRSDSSLTIYWDANKESDLWGYNIYLNGQKIEGVVLPNVHEFTIKKLGSRRNYEIAVESFDTSGNYGQKAVVSTTTMLATPIVNTIKDNDAFITGTADYFVNLTVYQGEKIITTGETNTIGSFKIPIEKLAAGTILTLKTESEEGNESAPVNVTVKDATPPTKPIVNVVTNRSNVVTGKAEANSTVTVKNGNTKLGSATASSNGTFSVNIKFQKAGTKLTVNAKDSSGNISSSVSSTVVDRIPPKQPTVNKVDTNDKIVTGKAERYSTVTVKRDGRVLGTTTVNSKGNYLVKINIQKKGTILAVTAKDKEGNISPKITTKVVKP